MPLTRTPPWVVVPQNHSLHPWTRPHLWAQWHKSNALQLDILVHIRRKIEAMLTLPAGFSPLQVVPLPPPPRKAQRQEPYHHPIDRNQRSGEGVMEEGNGRPQVVSPPNFCLACIGSHCSRLTWPSHCSTHTGLTTKDATHSFGTDDTWTIAQ